MTYFIGSKLCPATQCLLTFNVPRFLQHMSRRDIISAISPSTDSIDLIRSFSRFPQRMSREDLYLHAYRLMYFSRTLEEQFIDLFRKGSVKGTVTLGIGNEATSIGRSLPLRPGRDVVALMQRDSTSHIIMGSTPYDLLCQYMANADSPTHAREGNVHHGDPAGRRFPMISHLGNMLATVIGGVWAARRKGEDAVGMGVIGDGGTSTGDFHESLNLASVRNVPVLFFVENNYYAYSTPTKLQYNCARISDRAKGYGIEGKTIDGTDIWEVYNAVFDAIEHMQEHSCPYLLESMTLRLMGHAVYDKAEYVRAEEREEWAQREPLAKTRSVLTDQLGITEEQLSAMESRVQDEIEEQVDRALACPRPIADASQWKNHAPAETTHVEPFEAKNVKNLQAVNQALTYILEKSDSAVILGQDIGVYGSAFKSCKGLYESFGCDRVIDTPICESATTGFALGASQIGSRPIIEFQFADFATEAVTQLAINSGTWYYRSGYPAPVLYRLPSGGGITLGAFHSGEFEGMWSRFPGLKILYPSTPQETFEALVGGFYDQNPCLVFEHKLLYWSQAGDIDFDGNLTDIFRPRFHSEGDDITVITWGGMLRQVLAAASDSSHSLEIINPFILNPTPMQSIVDSVRRTGRLLVVQESGTTAGLGHTYISSLTQLCFGELKKAPVLVAAPDIPVPFAPELEKIYLPSKEDIVTAIDQLMGE